MGQKVNPVGLRLGINRTWDSRWFADGADYGRLLHDDIKVRRALKKRLYQAGVSRIYMGIHLTEDDFTGRQIGSACGKEAWALAQRYFDGTAR